MANGKIVFQDDKVVGKGGRLLVTETAAAICRTERIEYDVID